MIWLQTVIIVQKPEKNDLLQQIRQAKSDYDDAVLLGKSPEVIKAAKDMYERTLANYASFCYG